MSLVGYRLWCCKESDIIERVCTRSSYVNVVGLGLGAPLVIKDQQQGISWEQVRNAESQALPPAPHSPPLHTHTHTLAGKSPFEQKAPGKFSCTLTCEKH